MTERGWLVAQLGQGRTGVARINAHVMATYAEPLGNYVAGSSFRVLGAPPELVAGFFASRLAQDGYFERWIESGLPLRRWLINGFLFYLQEEARRQRAEREARGLLGQFVEPGATEGAAEQFDRLWAAAMVRSAAAAACERCASEGFARHWEMFEQHFVAGVTYTQLSERFSVTGGQAASMVRTASTRFRQAMVDLLRQDGATEATLDDEVARLLRELRTAG